MRGLLARGQVLVSAVVVGTLATVLLSAPAGVSAEDTKTRSLDLSQPMFSKLSAEQRQLLLRYYENYWLLVDLYDNCTMAAESREFSFSDPSAPEDTAAAPDAPRQAILRRITRFVYYANGGTRYRLDRHRLRLENPATVHKSHTGIITPSRSYLFQRGKDGSVWMLGQKAPDESDMSRLRRYSFVNAPYACDGDPLETMLFRKPNYAETHTINDVSIEREGGQRLGIVTLSYTTEHGSVQATLKFLADRNWALKELFFTSALDDRKEGDRRHYSLIRCSYREEGEGTPHLATMLKEHGDKLSDGTMEPHTRREYTVVSFKAAPAELSEFDVERLVDE